MLTTHDARQHRRTQTGVASQRMSRATWPAVLIAVAITGAVISSFTRAGSVARIATQDASAPVSEPLNAAGLFTSFDRRRSHNGLYAAAVISTAPAASSALQAWTIHVARRQRRIAHAKMTVDVWMPETELRSPIHPSVRYVGDGNYRVDSLAFPHPGWWNVALVIDSRFGTDSLAFNLLLPAHQPVDTASPKAGR